MIRSNKNNAPALSMGRFPEPHLGECTQDGQPSSQGHRNNRSRHRREQFRKARESRTAQPRAAGQPIIHENGGHTELRVHGRGNAAEIVTVRHDHQRHEPDTRMFQRVDGAHEMHEAVLGSPARAIRHAKPQALRLENQRRQIQRHDAEQPVVGDAALLIAGNRLRDPQPPERDGAPNAEPEAFTSMMAVSLWLLTLVCQFTRCCGTSQRTTRSAISRLLTTYVFPRCR